jgi:type I restriction enzyme, S subunit
MNKQSTYKLKEISNFEYGKMPKKNKIAIDGYPIFSGYRTVGYYPEYMYEKEKLIIIARGVGGTGKVKISPPFSYITNLSIIFNENKKIVDYKYLYYYLSIFDLKSRLDTGSCQSQITISELEEYKITIPEKNEQIKISNFLALIDSKIELNNRINSELESISKTLYDYWFMQFDFPNKNGKPYKSSGGKMIYNEELKRDIPEGWEVKEMNKLLTKNSVKFDFIDNKHDINTLDLSVMPSATMCLSEKNRSSTFGTNLFKLSKFDILFGGIRPYLLKAGFSPFEGLVTGTVHSFRVRNETEYNFSILTMTHKSMFNFAVANSKGTKMPVIGADDLLTYKIAYNGEIIKTFNEYIQFRDLIAHNIIENQKLTELRDWLLPMLMNGQVRVK